MSQIKFKPIDDDSPGYLRRMREAVAYRKVLEASEEISPDVINAMVGFLAQFVIEPEDTAAKIEALLDGSKRQFFELLDAITGTVQDGQPVPLSVKTPEIQSVTS